MKKTAAKGHHTRKHSGTKKHHVKPKKHTATKKHEPDAHQLHEQHLHQEHLAHLAHIHAVAKHPTHAKPRSLALSGTGCCAAEALAASLRLAGASVTAADVLTLHRLAGADDETGAPIGALLEAAAEFGLAGFRPVDYRPAEPGRDLLKRGGETSRAIEGFLERPAGDRQPAHDHAPFPVIHAIQRNGLLLGVDLPGPHAVLATPDGWWSWGELHCPCEFPDAVIEEAWAVSWHG